MPNPLTAYPSDPKKPGSIYDPVRDGTNFAVASSSASKIEVCLFDANDKEIKRIDLPRDGAVFHTFAPGIRPGQKYGLRVHGKHDPKSGLFFNPNKLLVDLYAKDFSGEMIFNEAIFSYNFAEGYTSFNKTDDAAYKPKCVVTAPLPLLKHPKPNIPREQMVIMEAHVRDTMLCPNLAPGEVPGTYAALASDAVIEMAKRSGATSIEIQPVHEGFIDTSLHDRGLSNYWNYMTANFFTPHGAYTTPGGDRRKEFREMVEKFHANGIEVILDVVYNHSSEGNELGPLISFKGIDNTSYYKMCVGGDGNIYPLDYTGCGNTLDTNNDKMLDMAIDSLEYWVTEMGVDGFRFDLASSLARDNSGKFDQNHKFFQRIKASPILGPLVNNGKMISESWDCGPAQDRYHVGSFPEGWSEWNGKFRDTVRRYWNESTSMADMVTAVAGTSPKFGWKKPSNSINFVTTHDGFSMVDLFSFNKKHNEANLKDSGPDDNDSWNNGAEGETKDAAINARRKQQIRNAFATLIMAQGTPMFQLCDLLGHSKKGNNDTFCQDNELSWPDWKKADQSLIDFVGRLTQLRREMPILRNPEYLHGLCRSPDGIRDITWLKTNGGTLHTKEEWEKLQNWERAFGVMFNGAAWPDTEPGSHRWPVVVNFNPGLEGKPNSNTLPLLGLGQIWEKVIDTSDPAYTDAAPRQTSEPGSRVRNAGTRSLSIWRAVTAPHTSTSSGEAARIAADKKPPRDLGNTLSL